VTEATIDEALAGIAAEPSERWPALVAARFAGDRALAAQALL
jgi:hypothetical protein